MSENIEVAIIGFGGVIVGAFVSFASEFAKHILKNRAQTKLDDKRKKLLKTMLDARDWHKLSTLSRVIGADADTTRRLLIDLEARGSELPHVDGEESWGLISKHPLDKIE
jgi:hypothetical protein